MVSGKPRLANFLSSETVEVDVDNVVMQSNCSNHLECASMKSKNIEMDQYYTFNVDS